MIVACHFNAGSLRAKHLALAMAEGINAAGDSANLRQGMGFDHGAGDVVVAYGWGSPELFREARDHSKSYVYLDLGWWNRKPAGREMDGFHKVMVNCREPCDLDDYLTYRVPGDRFDRQGVHVAPWLKPRAGQIIVAGMSAKSAGTFDLAPEEWERGMIEALRHVRWPGATPEVFYRPKPSWAGWTELPGAWLSRPSVALADALDGALALVTHHSNAAIDALCAGVAIHSVLGVARPFSTPVARLWDPLGFDIDRRRAYLSKVAYCQWSVDEMRDGTCWRFLRDSGLIP